MQKMTIGITSLLLFLGLLAAPAAVLAAPAITITPTATPPGGKVTITGSGFAANAALTLLAEQGPGQRFPIDNVQAGADGAFRYTLTVPGGAPPGTVTIIVASTPDMTELARGTFTVTNEPSVAPEQVRITPTSGPAGTQFVFTGTGFPAGATLVWHTAAPGRLAGQGPLQVGPDGRFTVTIDSTGYAPGEYNASVSTSLTAPPITGARFTVTAAMPGLPSTGGGAGVQTSFGWLSPIGVLALVGLGLTGGVALAQCRRSLHQDKRARPRQRMM